MAIDFANLKNTMKKSTILCLIVFIIFIMFSFNIKEMAKTHIALELNKSTIAPGEEFTVTVALGNINVAAYTILIYYDSSVVECISDEEEINILDNRIICTGVSDTGKNKKLDTILQLAFHAKEPGSAVFTALGEFYNEAGERLELDYGEAEITVSARGESQVAQNGVVENQTMQTGQNVVIGDIITEEENNVKEEKDNTEATSKAEDSSNTFLDSLHLNKEGISPDFRKDVTEYYLVVDENTEAIEIIAIPENINATVEVQGNNSLQKGENTIEILVTSANKNSQRKYKVHITKTNNLDEANANLETLAVENDELIPEFQEAQTQYKVSVSNTTEKINLLAIPSNSEAEVTIIGNENLKEGNNKIEIKVVAPNGTTSKVYVINAYKRTATEEASYQEQLQNEIVKANEVSHKHNLANEVNPTKTIETKLEEEEQGEEEKTKNNEKNLAETLISVVGIILAFIVAGIVGIRIKNLY